MTRRWPLHPPPQQGVALTSWLRGLAGIYGMTIKELIQHDLAPPGIDHADHHLSALDLDPPSWVLSALAERTGVPLGDVRRMTIAGQVPWLLDPLAPEPAPGVAFDTYVHQASVLLTAKERPRRQVPGWRAWLPTDRKRGLLCRACPTCLESAPAASFGFTLISRLPLTLSCPRHSCYLEPAFGGLGAFAAWEERGTRARAAPALVGVLDERTHEAMRTGMVTLPHRDVHMGVWFRLLRALIDELSTPVSALRTRSRHNIQRIWHTAGHPARGGIVGPWRPYEALPWTKQQLFLEAAATAVHLIETGKITAHGTLALLLTPQRLRPVYGGDSRPPQHRDYWKEARDALNEAIVLAQHDPDAARKLLAVLTAFTSKNTTFRVRDDLIDVGIPERHLPRTLAEARWTPHADSSRETTI